MNFRYDINGLRAIAVIAVVLFHFEPTLVPGGFSGVDVFFVISGFLMTGIIFKGLENEDFNLFNFYVSRANRIVPALAVLCFVLLLVGWFYLSPYDYQSLSKHIASSMAFLSNFIYWRESGYFEATAQEKWLLHTWSLSVEWQFYIIYPIVLILFKKTLNLSSLKLLIVVGTILGFAFSVIGTLKWPNSAYYLLPTRAWEMMVGGVAFLYPLNLTVSQKKITEALGLSLIIGSYLFVSSDVPWPGQFALIPVFGAYLIIVSDRQSSVLTNNRVFQFLGKLSYSIYLWHWPIVVYGCFFYVQHWVIYGLILSVIFGYISYNFVEKFKFESFSRWFDFKRVIPMYIILLILGISSIIFVEEGMPYDNRKGASSERSKFLDLYRRENYLTFDVYNELRAECDFFDVQTSKAKDYDISNACFTPRNDSIRTGLLWGDSHAQALSSGLRHKIPEIDLLQVASSGCIPSIDQDVSKKPEFRKSCDLSNQKAFDTLITVNPDFVFLAQRNNHDLNDFNKIIDKARQYGNSSKFILLGPVPQWKPSLPRAIALRHFDTDDIHFDDPYFLNDLFRIDKILKEKYFDSNLVYISLLDELCDDLGCLAKVDNDNTPIVWDYGHLSLKGSNYIAENIIKPRLKNDF